MQNHGICNVYVYIVSFPAVPIINSTHASILTSLLIKFNFMIREGFSIYYILSKEFTLIIKKNNSICMCKNVCKLECIFAFNYCL